MSAALEYVAPGERPSPEHSFYRAMAAADEYQHCLDRRTPVRISRLAKKHRCSAASVFMEINRRGERRRFCRGTIVVREPRDREPSEAELLAGTLYVIECEAGNQISFRRAAAIYGAVWTNVRDLVRREWREHVTPNRAGGKKSEFSSSLLIRVGSAADLYQMCLDPASGWSPRSKSYCANRFHTDARKVTAELRRRGDTRRASRGRGTKR